MVAEKSALTEKPPYEPGGDENNRRFNQVANRSSGKNLTDEFLNQEWGGRPARPSAKPKGQHFRRFRVEGGQDARPTRLRTKC